IKGAADWAELCARFPLEVKPGSVVIRCNPTKNVVHQVFSLAELFELRLVRDVLREGRSPNQSV
ncbi:MAG: hypothetical protein ACTH0F_11820, partial [Microbacterium sp.]